MTIDKRADIIIEKPTASDLQSLRALWADVFGDGEEFLDSFFGIAFSTDRAMVARDTEGNILSALYWLDCCLEEQRIAYIYGVGTAPSARGIGLCSRVMEAAHSALMKEGYSSAILVPVSRALFGFYGRLGYKPCTEIRALSALAEYPAQSVRQIDKAEYAALRRKYIPTLGVLQEGVSLDFLGSQMLFFAGEGCVFTAYIKDNRLICPELLGDTSRPGAIVSAMGCESGSFRLAGEGIPFTMIYPLSADAIIPGYFGLAFD